MLEKFSMAAIVEKLSALGGDGKWLEREWRIRVRLCWHNKAKSAIRHMVHGERKPSLQEATEIELAYVKHCAERIEASRGINEQLFAQMRASLDAMQQSDPEFYRPHIEAVRDILLRGGNLAGDQSGKN